MAKYSLEKSARLCFEPAGVEDALKYKALKYNFVAIPVTAAALVGISFLDIPSYCSFVALGVYGATMGRLFKKFYPESRDDLMVMRLFDEIKSRRKRRRMKPTMEKE